MERSRQTPATVIPAQAGIHGWNMRNYPKSCTNGTMDPGLRRDDGYANTRLTHLNFFIFSAYEKISTQNKLLKKNFVALCLRGKNKQPEKNVVQHLTLKTFKRAERSRQNRVKSNFYTFPRSAMKDKISPMWGSILSIYQRIATRRMFTRWSPIYEEEVSDNAYSAADRVAVAAIKYLAARDLDDPTIVDVGIGTGLLAQQIYDSMPCVIIGLDFTEDMLAVCAARNVAELLIKCDAGKDSWPIEHSGMDMVVSAGLLEYLTPEMLQHFLRQTHLVLQQNAPLIFTYLPVAEGAPTIKLWHGHSGTYLTCGYTPAAMESLLIQHGFKITEHSKPFTGCVFHDGSSYDYRLIAAHKT